MNYIHYFAHAGHEHMDTNATSKEGDSLLFISVAFIVIVLVVTGLYIAINRSKTVKSVKKVKARH